MPRPNSTETHLKAGADVHMRRLSPASSQWFNTGVLNSPPSISNTVQELESFDERAGARLLDERSVTEFKESFTVDTRDHEAELMALFLGAAEPAAFSQMSGSVVAESHAGVKLGGYIMLGAPAGGATPARKYDVSAVTVKDMPGTTTYVAGVDYVLDAIKGVIRIPTNSSIVDLSTITVDYTHAQIDTEAVLPQTAIQGVEVEIELWEVSDDGAKQRIRTIPRARVSTSGQRTMGVANDNFIQLSVSVLADASSATPAGQYVVVK